MVLELLFNALFFVIPFIFFPRTSEVFEFNKIVGVYIFTVLICGIWVINMIRSKKFIFKRTLLDIPLLLFLGSQIISTIFSIDVHTSIFGFYGRFNGGLISIICYCLLYWAYVSNITARATQKIITTTLIAAVLVAIYGILEHFGYSLSCVFITGRVETGCWVQDVEARVFATLGQPNWLAAYVVALIPLALSKKKSLWIIASVILFLALLFTKSRSGFIAFGVASVIFWIFNLRDNFKKFLLLNLIFLGLFLVFRPVNAPIAPTDGPALESAGTESGEIRKIVWQGAIDMWRAYPITGSGVETFGLAYPQFKPIVHNLTSEWDFLYNKAHNEFLNFAATTGIGGIVSYLILIIFSLKQLSKNHALLASYTSILLTNFFGFSVVVTSLLFFLLPAMAAAATKLPALKLSKKPNNFLVGFAAILGIFLVFLIGRYWWADYSYARGVAAADRGEYKEAINRLLTAIDTVPYEPIYHNDIARLYSDISGGLLDQNEASASAEFGNAALYEAQTALIMQPRNINIIRSAAGILASHGYVTDSINLLEDTKQIAPTDPRLYYTLGRRYLAIDEKEKAIDAFQKALELKPNYEEALRALESVK